MDIETLKTYVQNIVADAKKLKDKHTNEENAPVNYACIFSQTEKEYAELNALARDFGTVAMETNTGSIYHIEDLPTTAGLLKILKIRIPDTTRTERGDADFTVSNYSEFKKISLEKPGFKLIERPHMEMLELMEDNNDIRVYFSNPPVDRQLLAPKGYQTT